MNKIIAYNWGEIESSSANTEKMVTWRFSQLNVADRVGVDLCFCGVFQAFGEVLVKNEDEVREIISDSLRLNNDRQSTMRHARQILKHSRGAERFLIKHRLLEQKERMPEALITTLTNKSTEILSWNVRKADAGVQHIPTRFLFVDLKVDEDALVFAFDNMLTPKPSVKEVKDKKAERLDRGWKEVFITVVKE